MEHGKGISKAGTGKVKRKNKPKPKTPEERENFNRRRRELYHTDPRFKEKTITNSRNYYRRKRPKPSTAIDDGTPGIPPKQREVVPVSNPDADPEFMGCYTLPELAQALDKSLVTTRTWLRKGYLPQPSYQDTRNGYRQFPEHEVNAVVKVLAEHMKTYAYLNDNHVDVLKSISEKVQEAREAHEQS